MLDFTKVYEKNFNAWKDDKIMYVINQGGTSASKTFSILQLLIAIGIKYKYQIDVVGLSVPHLKTGVLTDMRSICPMFGIDFDANFKESDKILKLPGGFINFLAFDKLGKAHGGRRDILYINEANHIGYPIAEQLMIRTRKKVFIDYNPTNAFWAHKELIEKEPDKCCFIKSTYKDNKFLEKSIVDAIESRRGDGNNNFWRVYGMGELGITEGLVFNNFEQKEFDINAFEIYRNGVDWGFSNDPFAFVRVAIENKDLYICQEIYQRELLNKDSAPKVREIVGGEIVRCDSAEPKSIKEFQQYGIKAIPVKKGAGSIESGIKFMQSFDHIYIHPNCPNTYDEFCNYQWRMDKMGEQLPEPVDAFNHCLVPGTMIETDKGLKPIENITIKDKVLTRQGFKRVLWAGVSDKNRKIYKVTTDKGNFVIGTGNHKIFANNSFSPICSIKKGDKVLINKNGFVVGRVLTVQEQGIESEVYDLTVEDCHEFFANGILVHNCIDAIRYSLEADMTFNKAKAITRLW